MTYPYYGDDIVKHFRPKDKDGAYILDTEWSYVDTWKAMEKLPKEKVRAIGVSNFSVKTLVSLVFVIQ